jgi:hypothetical protein
VGSEFTSDRYLLNNLNTTIINCVDSKSRAFSPHLLRYECEAEWIRSHQEVERVFHSDAHDVFFQGNPFSEALSPDALSFVVEPRCVRTCGWNLAWIRECYGSQTSELLSDRFIVCSGSIGGSASEFLKLIELMMSQNEWEKCWGPSYDQAILNYLIWTGEVKKRNISYGLNGCDSGFYTMQWCVRDEEIVINSQNQLVSRTGNPPRYLHQYNRFPAFMEFLMTKCHIPTE